MIKFFRKIRYDLMEKNKTGKYLKYAIGEILLVVIGILLALQINNWNQNRLNNIKEQSILSSIHKEFLMNKVQLDTVLFYHRRAFKSARKLIETFPIDITKDNLDTAAKHIEYMSYTWTFNPSQGSINAIISTSSFDIIRNEE